MHFVFNTSKISTSTSWAVLEKCLYFFRCRLLLVIFQSKVLLQFFHFCRVEHLSPLAWLLWWNTSLSFKICSFLCCPLLSLWFDELDGWAARIIKFGSRKESSKLIYSPTYPQAQHHTLLNVFGHFWPILHVWWVHLLLISTKEILAHVFHHVHCLLFTPGLLKMPAKLSVKTKLGLTTDSLSKCVGVGYKLGRYMQWLQLQAACVGMGVIHLLI